jgi:molybdopterin converting factor small subunit
MRVMVLLFASYADAVGERSFAFDLPPGGRAEDVLVALRARPGGAALPPHPLLAVNERYADPAQVLAEGDVLAVLPPVAGG